MMVHYVMDCPSRSMMLCLAMYLEASSCAMGSRDCDKAASLVVCRDLCMVEMEGSAIPPKEGYRYRELGLAQRGILSHFLRNLVQQASRILDTNDGSASVIFKIQPILAGRARR